MIETETLGSVKPLSIDAIRSKSDSSDNNLALVPNAFARFAQSLSNETLHISSISPSFSFEGFCRSEARLTGEAEENSCISEILVCGELQQSVRVTIDRAIVFGICDVVFGGTGNEPAFAETRPFSKIERAMAQLFFRIIGRSLPSAFTGRSYKEFFSAPAQDPNEESLYPAFKPLIYVRILCNVHGYSGELIIELPEELATQFRPADAGRAAAKSIPVSKWESQVAGRIESMEMELTAVLAEFQMSLQGIGGLRLGQLIKLESDIASPLALCSEGVALFSARLGQTAKKYCLSIEAPARSFP
jgi:flagellar motor switch protein FliM